MKRKGQHPHHALKAVSLKAKQAPGRYADGNGLYLVVEPSGAKRWVLRTVIQGRRTDIGLGGLSVVSLKEAREKALAARKLAREGGDPLAERKRAKARGMTFEQAAIAVHASRKDAWRNDKHAAQWINTLREYVFPVFGKKAISRIESPDVLTVLSAIWQTKPETARRVRQRISTVMDWAKAKGLRSGDNPVKSASIGLPDQPKAAHHAALEYSEVSGFIEKLRECDTAEVIRLAFEFLILTATRTSEVLLAKWDEIDGDAWTIPAERMKSGKAHRVPLSPRCVEILNRAKELRGGEGYIFPGRMKAKPLTNMVFLMTLRRMNVDTTAHGFRSSFRDWASEKTNFPRDLCEMALAHTVRDKTEAAYRRGDLFDRRRELMDTWAAYATAKRGEVIPLRAAKK
jgi:integrase